MVVSQKTWTVLEKFYSGPEILKIVPKSSFRAQTKRPPISPKYILHYLHLHLYILYLYTYILTPIYICRHTFKIPTSTSLDGLWIVLGLWKEFRQKLRITQKIKKKKKTSQKTRNKETTKKKQQKQAKKLWLVFVVFFLFFSLFLVFWLVFSFCFFLFFFYLFGDFQSLLASACHNLRHWTCGSSSRFRGSFRWGMVRKCYLTLGGQMPKK